MCQGGRSTRRIVYVLCHTHIQAARCSVYLTSLLSLPLPLFFLPSPSLQGKDKYGLGLVGRESTALMYASIYSTVDVCSVEAIVAADPHPDHIRMTGVGSLRSTDGRIALMIAALNGKSRIVDILIKADPSGDHLNMKVG